jgi:hypothetical protein
MKHALWAICAFILVGWALIAIVRPDIPFNYSKRYAAQAGIPWPFDRWLSSRWFRIQLWVGGAIAFLMGIALLGLLFCDLFRPAG